MITDLEKECREVLIIVLDFLTPARFAKFPLNEYEELMNMVRHAIHHVTNKEYGCASGLHAGVCNCVPGKPGTSKYKKERSPQ